MAYLILYRHRTHSREILAEIFWGEKNQVRSRASLNTALWQLRNVMEPASIPRGTYLITNSLHEVGFNHNSPFWLDIEAFENETSQVLQLQRANIPDEAVKRLENAVALYRGDLLEGFYDDWVLREREYLRSRYISALAYLMDIYRLRLNYEFSIVCAKKILAMDPLREEVHRYLIKLYMETGQRVQAVRQYEICCEVLARELHIEPMQETHDLYQGIISPSPVENPQTCSSPSCDLQFALQHLHQAQTAFEQARDQLRCSIQVVENALQQLGYRGMV